MKVTCNLESDVYEALREFADDNDLPISRAINEALDDYFFVEGDEEEEEDEDEDEEDEDEEEEEDEDEEEYEHPVKEVVRSAYKTKKR